MSLSHFAVTLTPAERGWVAATISDAATASDIDRAARLIEARIETLIQRRLAPIVALADEWMREASTDKGACPDGLCGTCTQGNLAHLLTFAIEESNDEARP